MHHYFSLVSKAAIAYWNTILEYSYISTSCLAKEIIATWSYMRSLKTQKPAHHCKPHWQFSEWPTWIKDWAVKGTEYSHMYTYLTLDVIAISQATKFLLASCVPYIKFNRASVSMEHQRMNFNTQRCYSDKKKSRAVTKSWIALVIVTLSQTFLQTYLHTSFQIHQSNDVLQMLFYRYHHHQPGQAVDKGKKVRAIHF